MSSIPQTITLAVSQSRTRETLSSTLSALSSTTKLAAKRGAHLILFPEAYLGGYPRTCDFGAKVGSRSDEGREQFLNYWKNAVDLGDTPSGLGDGWVDRTWLGTKGEGTEGKRVRGDGTREYLEDVARGTGVFLVVGVVEKAGGSLYCSCLYVCPKEGCLGKRRKVMPTGSERLVWAQGSPSTLKAITTTIRGVKLTLAAAICWENYMPLLRHSLYSQNVNLYLAPTADARDTWLPLLQTIALEGRTFVLSANQCVRESNLPAWIHGKPQQQREEFREHKQASGHEPSPSSSLGTTTRQQDEHKRNLPGSTGNQHAGTNPNSERVNGGLASPPLANGTMHESAEEPSHDINVPREQKPSRHRRSSIIARTSDNHELRLPAAASSAHQPNAYSEPSPTTFPTSPGPLQKSPFACRGGSAIVAPTGAVLAGPLWEVEEDDGGGASLLLATVDFDDCTRGRLDFDAAGSYSRNDSFRLVVEGLVLDPPE